MNTSLRDVLGLPDARQAVRSNQNEQFKQSFSNNIAGVNQHLQFLAGQADRGDLLQLEAQKMKLYEAFQMASSFVDSLDPSKVEQSVERVLAAVKATEIKALETRADYTAKRDQWMKYQSEFDDLLVRVGELEDAGNPKAGTLRKLAEAIRSKANCKSYDQSITAYEQLRPKFDQIYQQHKQESPNTLVENMTLAKAAAVRPSPPSKGAGADSQKNPAAAFIAASVGKGGKNNPADVKAVQEALNQRGGAKLVADGKFGPKTLKAIQDFQRKLGQFKPDGLVEPRRGTARALSGAAQIPPTPAKPKPIAPPVLPKATLDKGAFVWHSTREILGTNISELKKGVMAAYGTEHRDLLTAIDGGLQSLGKVVDKLDIRLADALDSAYKAPSDEARVPELKKAEGIMKEYLAYIKAEPLIDHMDDNPFGVKTSLKKVITDALDNLSELLPEPVDVRASLVTN